MSYLDKVTVGSTTYDIQDSKAQGDIGDLKSATDEKFAAIADIPENIVYVTNGATGTLSGITYNKVAGKRNTLELYGTASLQVNISPFNGENESSNGNSLSPDKYLSAGKYTVYFSRSDNDIKVYLTTSTVGDRTELTSGQTITVEENTPACVFVRVNKNGVVGTSENPATLTIKIYRGENVADSSTAIDNVARAELDTVEDNMSLLMPMAYADDHIISKSGSLSSSESATKQMNIPVILFRGHKYKISFTVDGTITLATYFALYASDSIQMTSSNLIWKVTYDGTTEYVVEYDAERDNRYIQFAIYGYVGNVTANVSLSEMVPNKTAVEKLIAEDKYLYADNLISIFESFAVIGDSLSDGFVSNGSSSYSSATTRAAHRNWPSYLALDTGRTVNNLARGGSSVHDWRYGNTSKGVDISTADIDTYCYMIALGVNDIRSSLSVGTSADIAQDKDSNADTFYGNYDWLVRQLIAYKTARISSAKILVFTIPNTENADDYNTAIRYVASLYDDVHVIDLAVVYPSEFREPPLSNVWIGNHSRPIGYAYISKMIKRAVNRYMCDHPDEFAYTPWAPLE